MGSCRKSEYIIPLASSNPTNAEMKRKSKEHADRRNVKIIEDSLDKIQEHLKLKRGIVSPTLNCRHLARLNVDSNETDL